MYLDHLDAAPDADGKGDDDEDHGEEGEQAAEEAATASIVLARLALIIDVVKLPTEVNPYPIGLKYTLIVLKGGGAK